MGVKVKSAKIKGGNVDVNTIAGLALSKLELKKKGE